MLTVALPAMAVSAVEGTTASGRAPQTTEIEAEWRTAGKFQALVTLTFQMPLAGLPMMPPEVISRAPTSCETGYAPVPVPAVAVEPSGVVTAKVRSSA